MKYAITRACGHEETVNLFGSSKDRVSRLKWLESTICSRCYRIEQEEVAANECDEVEMLYSKYKQEYANCLTKSESYNSEQKTIIVYVPRNMDPEQALRERKKQRLEGLNALGITNETAAAYIAMGATGVRQMVEQAEELLGQHNQVEDLVTLGLTEDAAKSYIKEGPSVLRGATTPLIELLKLQEQYDELIAIGFSIEDAKRWVELGAEKVQKLYDQAIEKLKRDKIEITSEIDEDLAFGRKIIEILKK